MQGCPLRCSFCHNPDTWQKESNFKLTSKEVVDEVRKYRSYIEMGGGVTFSGGEPLLQSEFLLETLKLALEATARGFKFGNIDVKKSLAKKQERLLWLDY